MTVLRTPPLSIREKIDQLSARAEFLEHQLIESQRLATLGTLSSIVAHEFNNVLMNIINQADTALATDREETMRRALEKTLACGEQASQIIGGMLGYARTTNDHEGRWSAAELVDEALELTARDPAKDGIRVERDYDDHIAVAGPKVRYLQVLLNLILNARQAMADSGGTLTLRVYRHESYACFEVADTGPGIPPEHVEQLFDPFFTTKDSPGVSGGTGLGLYLSRHIAQEHCGDIAVESQPGQGARFTVYLPAAE